MPLTAYYFQKPKNLILPIYANMSPKIHKFHQNSIYFYAFYDYPYIISLPLTVCNIVFLNVENNHCDKGDDIEF